MNKFYVEDPFIVDPLIMIYAVGLFLVWYIKRREKSDADLRLVDVALALGAHLYIIFIGFLK